MIEMARRFVRQKFGSPGLVAALAVLALVQTLGFAHGAGPSGFSVATWAIFVLAAGSVSRDIGSGALQMILSRPIRRTQYLFGRYAGILVAFALFLVFTSLVAFVVVSLAAPAMAGSVSPARLATLTYETLLSGAFTSAILLFFSTFLPGIVDLLGLLMLYIVLHLPGGYGTVFTRVSEVARENMVPEVSWSDAFRGQGPALAAAGRWVFALTVYLALAAVVFSRRELPYGHD